MGVISVIGALVGAAVASGPSSQTSETFTERFPEHQAEFTMVRVPDGRIEVDGKTTVIKNLYFGQAEIPWQVFEIWALRLDLSVEQQKAGVDAESRPSKPYAVIFTGFGHHDYPAMCMSQASVELFCGWLSRRTGRKYRTPTVAEWRYAVGPAPANLADYAWFWDNSDSVTHPLMKKRANAFGLYDMLGNVAEWTIGPEGKWGVSGGSWKDDAVDVTPASFRPSDPKWNENDPQTPKSRWWLANGQFVGLRLVCDGPAGPK